MEFKELLEFVELEDKRLKDIFKVDEDKYILAQTVKLMEEVGELSNEILVHKNLQRKKKLEKSNLDDIKGEFADVIFTTILLANQMNVDIRKALADKIEKINKRYEK